MTTRIELGDNLLISVDRKKKSHVLLDDRGNLIIDVMDGGEWGSVTTHDTIPIPVLGHQRFSILEQILVNDERPEATLLIGRKPLLKVIFERSETTPAKGLMARIFKIE